MFSHLLPILAIALLLGPHLAQASHRGCKTEAPIPFLNNPNKQVNFDDRQACSHRGYTTEALIPFLDNPDKHFNFDNIPKVHVRFSTVGSVEGSITRSYDFAVDTGSCGLLMAASALDDWNPSEGTTSNEGFQFYSSSKRLYTGYWVERNVYFNYKSNDEVKAVLKILVITKEILCPDYKIGIDNNQCPYPSAKEIDPDKLRMMGIGFGCKGNGPDTNPILNIQKIRQISVTLPSTSYWPGWIITPAGLTVGLTENNYDAIGFHQHAVQLPKPGLGGGSMSPPFFPWGQLPGCMSIDNVPNPCLECSVLLDSGLDQSYISIPSSLTYPTHPDPRTGNRILNAGQTVDIAFGRHREAWETFKVDDTSNKVTPRITYIYHNDINFPFVNTGRHAFRAWEVAFDPMCGILAFHEVV